MWCSHTILARKRYVDSRITSLASALVIGTTVPEPETRPRSPIRSYRDRNVPDDSQIYNGTISLRDSVLIDPHSLLFKGRY